MSRRERDRVRRTDRQAGAAAGEPDASPKPEASGSAHWLLALIQRYFKKFWEQADAEYFQEVYGTTDKDAIADTFTRLVARNASLLGAFTGVLMSVDEVVAFATGGEGGLGLPVNILLAVAVLSVETVLLIRYQLALVAYLGKLYGVPLDPDDPEDALTIFAYAAGGSSANAAGRAGMKVGGKLAARIAKSVAQREAMAALTRIAERVGIRILQLAVVKYAVPVVSIAIGMVVNYYATRAIGRIAKKHMRARRPRPHQGL